MRRLSILLTALVTSFIGFAQTDTQKTTEGRNSFFAEAGGPSIMFSANLDRRFTASNLGIGGRIGIGFVTAWDEEYDPVTGTYRGGRDRSVATVPVQLNYIFGKADSPHTFEAGVGVTYMGRKLGVLNFYDETESKWFGTFTFMYRRQPKSGGFSWRAGFTPLVAKGFIQPMGGLSLGYKLLMTLQKIKQLPYQAAVLISSDNNIRCFTHSSTSP